MFFLVLTSVCSSARSSGLACVVPGGQHLAKPADDGQRIVDAEPKAKRGGRIAEDRTRRPLQGRTMTMHLATRPTVDDLRVAHSEAARTCGMSRRSLPAGEG